MIVAEPQLIQQLSTTIRTDVAPDLTKELQAYFAKNPTETKVTATIPIPMGGLTFSETGTFRRGKEAQDASTYCEEIIRNYLGSEYAATEYKPKTMKFNEPLMRQMQRRIESDFEYSGDSHSDWIENWDYTVMGLKRFLDQIPADEHDAYLEQLYDFAKGLR